MNFNRALVLSIFTVLFSMSMQFIFIRYSSYYIAKNDYGNFVLLQTLIAGLSAVLLQLPGQSFDRFYNISKNKILFVNEFRSILIFINLIGMVIIILFGIIFNKYSLDILAILFVYFVITNNYTLNQKILLLNQLREKYLQVKILESLSKFIFPILSYSLFHTLISIFFGMIIGYIISYYILIIYLKDFKFKFIIFRDNIKKYILFAYPILFVSVFTWGISFSDRYFIEYFLSTTDVAIYSLLAVVAGIGQVTGQIYFMYAEPKILKKYDQNAIETHKIINNYIIKLFVLFIILSIIALIMPKFIYTLLLEPKIVYSKYYFQTMMILLFSSFLNILHIAHHMHLKLANKLNVLAYIFLIAFIVNLIGNFFIKNYGIIAAAYSTLAAYSTILIIQILYVQKILFSKVKNNV